MTLGKEHEMEFVVWGSVPIGNACVLEGIEDFDGDSDLVRGRPRPADFPGDAVMAMTQRHKKNTRLLDDVSNFSGLKVCSPGLVEFLRSKKLKNVEYLMIKILDHKRKVASDEYCIVHPIHPQDVLDIDASKPRYGALIPTEIDSVKQTVLDTKRLDPEVRLFRIANFFFPVVLEKAIADEIVAKGFKGSTFDPLSTFTN
jgi:hypothetical protein